MPLPEAAKPKLDQRRAKPVSDSPASSPTPGAAVRVWTEQLVLPTYLPAAPDRNPMFLEQRVYQGSRGQVYPLPFTDRIAESRTNRAWKAVWLENEFLRVLILPEIGGRIHAIQDKTNGYDLIYHQRVIKPALVGLAGPWLSGGIEFNWPQHHRPATFLPTDLAVEEQPDGSRTVWLSDHDPLSRMKGMHGVCLHPGVAVVEVKVRAYNRTSFRQTFLWWANVATRVHEAYQSFFPPDVTYVADHARRSISEYPLAPGVYYGVNYGARARRGIPVRERPPQFVPPHCSSGVHASATGGGGSPQNPLPSDPPNYAPNDLSFYANIPTPCSYMALGSQEDFCGGYDYRAQAGVLHLANHHIAPGKKQWTWGNHEFGYAWDRHLADPDEQGVCWPYIEIMAGVFTDNQPDFSFLQPDETKTWSQFWYPLQRIGPPQHANLNAAVALRVGPESRPASVRSKTRRRVAHIGISVTRTFAAATIELSAKGQLLFSTVSDLAPGQPFLRQIQLAGSIRETDLQLRVARQGAPTTGSESGNEIIAYRPLPRRKATAPPTATEPPAPEAVASADELYLIGLHLEQYRHATRCATLYWREALRRDPLDARSNQALGRWHLRRGEWRAAEECFRRAIQRLTSRNPNPEDGSPFYYLGLCLRYQADAVGLVSPYLFSVGSARASRAPVGASPTGSELRWDLVSPRSTRGPTCSARRRTGHARRMCSPTAVLASALNKCVATGDHGRAEVAQLWDEAYTAFYKATWNQAWAAAGFHALAELDCRRGKWEVALDHLNRSLRLNTDNLRARNLKVLVLRRLADARAQSNQSLAEKAQNADLKAATRLLRETLALDPIDWWARYLNGESVACNGQVGLDIAHDLARAGFYPEAIEWLNHFVAQVSKPARSPTPRSVRYSDGKGIEARGTSVRADSDVRSETVLPDQSWGTQPLVLYTLGWLHERIGEHAAALRYYQRAADESTDYCFPARLEEIAILESAMRANPKDARAPYYLGNLLYDRRCHTEAIQLWERSVQLDPHFSVAWRNLGLGRFNISRKPKQARAAYDRAFRANPRDARLLYERDQLWKRLGENPSKRRRELEKYPKLVQQRDDLSLELCALYNQTGEPERALAILSARQFQPWEGGEGAALGQHVRTHLALGRRALAQAAKSESRKLKAETRRSWLEAVKHFRCALMAPANLGEAKHLLANQSDIHYWLGVALDGLGEKAAARTHWRTAATSEGDFQEMSVRAFSEMTYYSAMAWRRLGQAAKAKRLLQELLAYARQLQQAEAKIDYFATSLPTMLLFTDDVQFRQETTALFLQAQARLGLGQKAKAKQLLTLVLQRDPNHAPAADLGDAPMVSKP